MPRALCTPLIRVLIKSYPEFSISVYALLVFKQYFNSFNILLINSMQQSILSFNLNIKHINSMQQSILSFNLNIKHINSMQQSILSLNLKINILPACSRAKTQVPCYLTYLQATLPPPPHRQPHLCPKLNLLTHIHRVFLLSLIILLN